MTVADRIVRAAALATMLLIVAYPARVFLASPESPIAIKIVWVVCIGAGWVRPALGAWLLVGLVPFLPALPHLGPAVPHGVVHLVVVGLALPVLGRLVRGRGVPAADVVAPAFLLVVAIGFASLATGLAAYYVASPVPAAAIGDVRRLFGEYVFAQPGPHFPNGLIAFSTFADGLLAYLIVRTTVGRPSVHRTLYVAVGAAIVVSGLGIVQAFTGTALHPMWVQYDAGIRRINSTYSDPNALGAYLAMMLPVSIGLAGAAERSRQRWAWLAGGTLLGIALILTAGRMAVGAALIGLAILSVEAVRRHLEARDPWAPVRRGFRRGVVALGLAVAAVAVGLSVIGTARDMRHADQNSYLDTALYTLNLRQPLDEKLKGRLTFWRTALLMVGDAPVFGIGIGRVFDSYPAYSALVGGAGAGLSLSAHNTFLNVAAETGLAGLAAWLALLAMIYATAFRRDPDETRSIAWIRIGLAAGLAAYGATMLTGDRTILREDPAMFGAMAAIAALLAPGAFWWAARVRRAVVALCAILVLTWPVRAAGAAQRFPLDRVDWGFYGLEIDSEGQPFRWTARWSAFHVPGAARDVTVPVRRAVAPWPSVVTVTIDGRTADRVVLDDNSWRVLHYVMSEGDDRGRFHRIELRVDSPVIVPGDGREIAVMVGRHQWSARGSAAP